MTQNLALTFDALYMRRPGSPALNYLGARGGFVYRFIGTRSRPSPVQVTDAYTDADSGERVVCLTQQGAAVSTVLPESIFNERMQDPNPRKHFFASIPDGLQAWADFNAQTKEAKLESLLDTKGPSISSSAPREALIAFVASYAYTMSHHPDVGDDVVQYVLEEMAADLGIALDQYED